MERLWTKLKELNCMILYFLMNVSPWEKRHLTENISQIKNIQRIHGCTYSANSLELNNGVKYKPLLPAACRAGDYVGKYGFDCCSADPFRSAIDISECSIYFLNRE